MKTFSLTCMVLGLLAGVMAILTAIEAVPQSIDFLGTLQSISTSDDLPTVLFWVGVAGLLMLAALITSLLANKNY